VSTLRIIAGLLAGLVFGGGLAISGMTDPNKVLNFLDLFSGWDPSLALVMAGAIPPAALGFWLATKLKRPLFAAQFVLPAKRAVEPSLLLGSALFGIGWGLGGYCPGPALASISNPNPGLIAFLIAMLAGLALSIPVSRLRGLHTPRSA
jgi:hypothetical protein